MDIWQVNNNDKEINEMNTTEIVISRKLVYRIAIGLVILVALLLFGWKSLISDGSSVNGNELTVGSPEKFAFLSNQGSQRSVGST